jgi:hypothetical protein
MNLCQYGWSSDGGASYFFDIFWKDPEMNTIDVSAIARHLFETQGAKAIAEAAKKAEFFAQAGDREQAKLWQRVEAVLREMRGPLQS